MTKTYCHFLGTKTFGLFLICILVFFAECKNDKKEVKKYAVFIPRLDTINYPISYILRKSEKDSIKWNVYSNFFNDTIFHQTSITTVGELALNVERAIKLDSFFYREINDFSTTGTAEKAIGVMFSWYSNDTIINIQKESKLITGILFDSNTLDIIVCKYFRIDGSDIHLRRRFIKNTNQKKLVDYFKTNKKVNVWFKAEAIRRGYLVE